MGAGAAAVGMGGMALSMTMLSKPMGCCWRPQQLAAMMSAYRAMAKMTRTCTTGWRALGVCGRPYRRLLWGNRYTAMGCGGGG